MAPVSALDAKHDREQTITISLRNPEVGREYSVVFINEENSTIHHLKLSSASPSKEVPVAEGIPYCLVLFQHYDNGTISRDPDDRIYILPEPHPGPGGGKMCLEFS